MYLRDRGIDISGLKLWILFYHVRYRHAGRKKLQDKLDGQTSPLDYGLAVQNTRNKNHITCHRTTPVNNMKYVDRNAHSVIMLDPVIR